METITGFVEHIVYRNEENGYTVLNLASNEEDEITCVGVFQMISEGESLELTGVSLSEGASLNALNYGSGWYWREDTAVVVSVPKLEKTEIHVIHKEQ